MERIREDKKVIDEINRRKELEKNWEMYEMGVRPYGTTSTIITKEDTHAILESLSLDKGPILTRRKIRDNR